MIEKDLVKETVEKWLANNDYFLVDISFTPNDKIAIEIDHAEGVWIEDCASLSLFLQEHLGEEIGNYELEVGSAGIGQPFKVERQYVNHIGKRVEVMTFDGKKVQGTLTTVESPNFTITVREKHMDEGKKRPMIKDIEKTFNMNEIKYTKYIISFK